MSKICSAALLALITASFSAHAQTPQKAEAPVQKAGTPVAFPQRMNMRAEALKQFDKDGDGKLNEEERKAMMEARKAMGEKMRKDREKEFDKNGDGNLDDAEKTAMLEAQKARMEKFRMEREKPFDKDGDGKLSDAERKAMTDELQARRPNAGPKFQEMVKRFDKDGDGKLNDAERKALMDERMKEFGKKNAQPALSNAPAATGAATAPAAK